MEEDEFGIPIKQPVDEFGIPIKKRQVDEFGIPVKTPTEKVDEYGIPVKKAEFDFSDVVDAKPEFDFSDVVDENQFDFSDVVDPNPSEVAGAAISAQSPVLGGIYDFGRTVYSGLTDTAPQTAAQTLEVARTAINPSNIGEYIRNEKPVDFQRYVRDRDAKYSGVSGFFTPFNMEEAIPKYGEQFMKDEGLSGEVEGMKERLPETIERRKKVEEYVQQQKNEADKKLGGVVTDYRKIDSPSALASYVGNLVGQAAYQIPLALGTRGASSYMMEAATVYDNQLDRLSKENGISREEVIERNLDNPAAGQAYAMLAGALDAASAGNLVSAFRKGGGGFLKKFLNTATEALTEPAQGVLEEVGAGNPIEKSFDKEGMSRRVNELLGGLAGGVAFSAISTEREVKSKIQQAEAQADQAISELSVDPQTDAELDAEAQIDPADKQVLEEIKLSDAIQEEQKEVEAEEKLQKELKEDTEGTENRENTKSKEKAKKEVPLSQTPKWKAAEKEVEELQKAFMAMPMEATREESIAMALKLADARHVLQQLKGRPPTKTSEIKTRINETTGVAKAEKSVQLTPQQALAAQIRIQDRGIKIGRDLTQENVVSRIKEAAEEAKLSPKQVQAIARRGEKVTLTPKSIEKFNEYVSKVVADADYSDKLTQAEALRKKIRKKAKNATPQEKKSFKEFLQVSPDDTDVNDYIKTATEVTESFKPVTREGHQPLRLRNLDDFTSKQVASQFLKDFPENTDILDTADKLDLIKQKRAQERQIEQNERLRAKLEKDYTPEQVNSFMQALSNETDLDKEISDVNKKEQVRQVFKKLADQRQRDLPESIEDSSDKEHEILTSLKNANLSTLSADQLKLFVQLSDRITENGDFGKAGFIPVILKVQEDFKKLESVDFNILGISNFEQELSANLPAVFRAITGLPVDAAKFQLYLGIKGLNEAATNSVDASVDFVHKMNEMNDRHTKIYGSKNNGFTDESIFRQGIFAELIKHDALVNPDEFLVKNKEAVESTIDAYKMAEKFQDAKTYERLYAPFSKARTIAEIQNIMKRIDPAGSRVVDFIIDYMKPYGLRVNESNTLYFNKPTQDINNYAGESKWYKVAEVGKQETVDESDIQDIEGISNYRVRPANPKQDRSQLEFKRIIPKGKVLDFNLHSRVNHQIQRVHFKTEAVPYMLQVREMSKDVDRMKKVLGGKAKSDKLFNKIFDVNNGAYYRFENNLLSKGAIPTAFDRNMRSFMSVLRKWGYNLRLGGLTQWAKQPTVLINTMAQVGNPSIVSSSLSEIYSNPEGYKEFVKGETVSMRGEQKSLFNIGDSYVASLDRDLKNEITQAFRKGLSKLVDKGFENNITGIGALVKADRFAANPSFVAFYKKHLKDIGQQYQGFAEENKLRNTPERQEARAVAKQMLDDLQVVSNPAEMVAKLQSDRDYKTQIAKAVLFPFGGFSTSTKQRLWSDWRALATGNSKQRGYAAKDITATLAEQAVFQTINQFALGFLWDKLGDFYEWAFDLPTDDDEDKYKKWWQRTWTGMILDNLPLILTNPGEQILIDGVNKAGHELYKYKTGEDISYKKYADEVGLPLARIEKLNPSELDIVLDALGPITAPIQNLVAASKTTVDLFDENLEPEQKKLLGLAGVMQWANITGLWPSDLTSGTLREVREQKKMSKEDSGMTKHPTPLRPRPRPRPRPRIYHSR